MSFLGNLIGGMATAGGGILENERLSAQKMLEQDAASERQLERAKEMAIFNSELEDKKLATVEALKVKLENDKRAASAARIETAKDGIIGKALAGKYSVAVPADPSSWTPEMQSAVDQSKKLDGDKLRDEPGILKKAAIASGDLSIKDALADDYKSEAMMYKGMLEQQKEAGRNDRADARLASQQEASDKRLAYLFAALEKRGSKGGETATVKEALQFVDGSRKELANDAANLKAMYAADIKDKSSKQQEAIKADYAPKFAGIEAKRTQIETDFNSLREKVGLPTSAKPADKPVVPPAPIIPMAKRPPLSSFQK